MPWRSMPTVRRMKTKLSLMGEGGVGKTSLIRRFVLNEYEETYLHTVGTRVSKIELTVPFGTDLEVQMDMAIFDIMGQHGRLRPPPAGQPVRPERVAPLGPRDRGGRARVHHREQEGPD